MQCSKNTISGIGKLLFMLDNFKFYYFDSQEETFQRLCNFRWLNQLTERVDMRIFRHESTDWILKFTNRLLIRRNYASYGANLYEVLGLKRNATAVSATKVFCTILRSLLTSCLIL